MHTVHSQRSTSPSPAAEAYGIFRTMPQSWWLRLGSGAWTTRYVVPLYVSCVRSQRPAQRMMRCGLCPCGAVLAGLPLSYVQRKTMHQPQQDGLQHTTQPSLEHYRARDTAHLGPGQQTMSRMIPHQPLPDRHRCCATER